MRRKVTCYKFSS